MPLNCEIVGLPNVGKSTIFNALTSTKTQAANYPFCTIDPNTNVITIPNERLTKIANLIHPKNLIPTTMKFIDITDLIKNTSKNKGLNNQFLSHIRTTDAIAHVVRCFDDPEIIHVTDAVNPLHNINIINTKLLLADLNTVEKRHTKTEKTAKSNDPKTKTKLTVLQKNLAALNANKPARTVELTPNEKLIAHDLFLLTAKPQLYIANVDETRLSSSNAYTTAVEKRATEEGSQVVRIYRALESKIAQLKPAKRNEFLANMGLKKPNLNRLIHTTYHLLDLITYFTTKVQKMRT